MLVIICIHVARYLSVSVTKAIHCFRKNLCSPFHCTWCSMSLFSPWNSKESLWISEPSIFFHHWHVIVCDSRKYTNAVLHFPFLYGVKKKKSPNVLFISHNTALSFVNEYELLLVKRHKYNADTCTGTWGLRGSHFSSVASLFILLGI